MAPLVQTKKTGIGRLAFALRYSWAGLQAGWSEPAFRQETLAALLLVPLACWVGRTWVERALLIAAVLAVMVVELINTAIETAIDRIGLEHHALSKKAKDLGSAAVLLSLLFAVGVWLAAAVQMAQRW